MSRVVDKRYIFGSKEKEQFRLIMRKLEEFMGVHIITYCIMSNHWHILIEVPEQKDLSSNDLFHRIRNFYPKTRAINIIREIEDAKENKDNELSDRLCAKYTSRMNDLSTFTKELKERFSKWYNHSNERRGTLWEERFKSVLVEGTQNALSLVARYIDLNPVRANLVTDPKDYLYCGYGEAVAGKKCAQIGIRKQLNLQNPTVEWDFVETVYREHLMMQEAPHINPASLNIDLYSRLRCKIRYLSDGIALGSRFFIEEVFLAYRTCFGRTRTCGSKTMSGGDWQGLVSMQNFKNPISAPP